MQRVSREISVRLIVSSVRHSRRLSLISTERNYRLLATTSAFVRTKDSRWTPCETNVVSPTSTHGP